MGLKQLASSGVNPIPITPFVFASSGPPQVSLADRAASPAPPKAPDPTLPHVASSSPSTGARARAAVWALISLAPASSSSPRSRRFGSFAGKEAYLPSVCCAFPFWCFPLSLRREQSFCVPLCCPSAVGHSVSLRSAAPRPRPSVAHPHAPGPLTAGAAGVDPGGAGHRPGDSPTTEASVLRATAAVVLPCRAHSPL
ncbi:hypothetical protein ABZP36_007755 [Zizania latifolia]